MSVNFSSPVLMRSHSPFLAASASCTLTAYCVVHCEPPASKNAESAAPVDLILRAASTISFQFFGMSVTPAFLKTSLL